MSNKNLNDTADKSTESVKGAGKKAGKVGKKAGKALGKKAFSAGKKLLAVLAKKLVALIVAFAPIFLGLILLVSIIGAFFYFGLESRGTNQEYDIHDSSEQNKYTPVSNDYGDASVDHLSESNSFLQIFYEGEVADSYWKYYKNKDGETVLDYGANREPFHDTVVDEYNKEKFFQLNAMSLYALDEYLNVNAAATPQTFIKHVPFDVDEEGRLKSVPLTDEDGNLSVKSQAFEVVKGEKGDDDRAIYRKKYNDKNEPIQTEGVWDYGFAPVYHYKDYEKEIELRNSITGGQIWDKESQQMRKMTSAELGSFIESGEPTQYTSDEGVEGSRTKTKGSAEVPLVEKQESETVYMIQDAVTPLGVIKNEIEQMWRESGNTSKQTKKVTMSVPVKKKRTVQATGTDGKKQWYAVDVSARYVRNKNNISNTGQTGSGGGVPSHINYFWWNETPSKYGFPKIPKSKAEYNEMKSTIPAGWTVEFRETPTSKHTSENTGKGNEVMVPEEYYEWEERTHEIEVDSVEWEYIPRYVGNPDTSDLKSLDYYRDYFEYYENYVSVKSFKEGPLQELKKLREEEQEGIDEGKYAIPPTIEERKEGKIPLGKDGLPATEHQMMKLVRDLQLEHMNASSSGSAIDLSGVEFSSESDSKTVENASRYLEKFKEQAEIYGVDPMLLVAMAAQESGGSHEIKQNGKGSFGVTRSSLYKGNGYSDKAAIGLMQILPPQSNPTKPRTVTAYNHQTGEMEKFNASQQDLHDLDKNIKFGAMYLAYTTNLAKGDPIVGIGAYHNGDSFAHFINKSAEFDTWSEDAMEAYLHNDGGKRRPGKATYVQEILSKYIPTAESPFPYYIDRDGEKHVPEVKNLETPTGELINIGVASNVGGKRKRPNHKFKRAVETLEDFIKAPFRTVVEAAGWIGDGIKSIGKFLNLYDGKDTTNYYTVGSSVSGAKVRDLIYTTLAYEEGVNLSNYADLTEEELINLMIESFMNSVQKESGVGMGVNPNDFFPDGYQSPVKNVNILKNYGELSGGNRSDYIQLSVPGSTKIYAVADGVIESMDENSIIIDHGNGVKTIYDSVGSVNVLSKEIGDSVSKGDWIATGSNANGGFNFGLHKGGYHNPIWIVDPSALHGKPSDGSVLISPAETNFRHPYAGRSYAKTSDFGWRVHPVNGTRKFHEGADYAGTGSNRKVNQAIGSVDAGIINDARWVNGYGNLVVVEHPHLQRPDGRKVFTLYAHMVRPSHLSVGTSVQQGTTIGYEGNTGVGTGDHVHLELIVGHGDMWTQARGPAGANANKMDVHVHFR